jgi:hypothetical protein
MPLFLIARAKPRCGREEGGQCKGKEDERCVHNYVLAGVYAACLAIWVCVAHLVPCQYGREEVTITTLERQQRQPFRLVISVHLKPKGRRWKILASIKRKARLLCVWKR